MLLNQAHALEFMQRYDLDVLIATSPLHVTYLTDFSFWSSSLPKIYMSQPGTSAEYALQFFAVLPRQAAPALVLPMITAAKAETHGSGTFTRTAKRDCLIRPS